VFFRDGSATEKIVIEYPIGHRRRRAEGIPVLQQKAEAALIAHYGPQKAGELMALFADASALGRTPVDAFVSSWLI
jgi:2-methylcitrate dehydratase